MNVDFRSDNIDALGNVEFLLRLEKGPAETVIETKASAQKLLTELERKNRTIISTQKDSAKAFHFPKYVFRKSFFDSSCIIAPLLLNFIQLNFSVEYVE